jgi:gluconate 5-dehydrogenase
MKNLFDLTGKRALITGGTHGLGMSMAKGLGMAGAELIINGTTPEKMSNAMADYKSAGLKAHSYLFDVTRDEDASSFVDKIEKEIGPIDILINNAGIIKRVPAEEMSTEDFRSVINVDLIGPFIMSKYVGRKMIARKAGKIINICSMMSELGRNTLSAYASAKGGLKMLTQNLATEWAKHNIQVNGIGPGYFATSQTAPIREKGHPMNEFIVSRTPAGKWGDPDDLMGAAIFLSSKASDFVNGQVIYVDGGILATIGRPSNEK